MLTNINITNNEHTFKYIIEYTPDISRTDYEGAGYITNKDDKGYTKEVVIYDKDTDVNKIRKVDSYWHDESESELLTEHMPPYIPHAEVTVYFPEYSVDTYESNITYALDACTWIHGKKVILGSWLIDRLDCIACDRPRKFLGDDYYECYKVYVIDTYNMLYGDDWAAFREQVCGEPRGINNTEASIYFSMHVVCPGDGVYIKDNKYKGGQAAVCIGRGDRGDFLSLHINTNVDERLLDQPAVICDLRYNEVYNDIEDYLSETYELNDINVRYSLIIGNEDSVLVDLGGKLLNPGSDPCSEYIFKKEDIIEELKKNKYMDGMYIVCSFDVLDEDENSLLYIISNKIPLTPELYRYFINDFAVLDNKLNNVNLDILDMNLIKINAVNKIENKVYQLERHNDSKANMIQTSFYRVEELANIVIHPEVIENICINLDKYKNKVDSFILQIEGVCFNATGSTPNGVVFRIIGNMLPKETTSGTYYILNQDSELITTGKYIYVI